jgi:hypothetical protein
MEGKQDLCNTEDIPNEIEKQQNKIEKQQTEVETEDRNSFPKLFSMQNYAINENGYEQFQEILDNQHQIKRENHKNPNKVMEGKHKREKENPLNKRMDHMHHMKRMDNNHHMKKKSWFPNKVTHI